MLAEGAEFQEEQIHCVGLDGVEQRLRLQEVVQMRLAGSGCILALGSELGLGVADADRRDLCTQVHSNN